MKRYRRSRQLLPMIAVTAIFAVASSSSQPCDLNKYSDSATSSDVLMHSLNISENEEEEKIIMALCRQEENVDNYDNDHSYNRHGEEECEDQVKVIVSKRSDRDGRIRNGTVVGQDNKVSHPKNASSNASREGNMTPGRNESLTVKKKTKKKTKIIRQGLAAKEKKVVMMHASDSVLMKREETNPESHKARISKSSTSMSYNSTTASSNMQDSSLWWTDDLKRTQSEIKHPQSKKRPKDDIICTQPEERHVHYENNDSNGLQQSLLQPQGNDVVFKQQQQKQQQQQHRQQQQNDSHGNTSISVTSSKKISHHPLRLHTTRKGTNLIIPASMDATFGHKHQEPKQDQAKEMKSVEKPQLQQQQQLKQQQQQQQQQTNPQQERNPIQLPKQLPKKSIPSQQRQPKPSTLFPTTMSLTTPWARKFISSRPKDALLPIPREFLSDGFNLVHLAPIVERAVEVMKSRGDMIQLQTKTGDENSSIVPPTPSSLHHMSLYKAALRLILEEGDGISNSHRDSNDGGLTDNSRSIAYSHAKYSQEEIQKAAEVLYILVHARYASSPRGLDTIKRMFQHKKLLSNRDNVPIHPIFGQCCRIPCKGMPLLPIGMSDCYDIEEKGGVGRRAMRYCPCCREMFYMWDSKVDGAAWGTSFAHLFLMVYGSDVFASLLGPSRDGNRNFHDESSVLVQQQPRPTIFGFPLHPSVYSFKRA